MNSKGFNLYYFTFIVKPKAPELFTFDPDERGFSHHTRSSVQTLQTFSLSQPRLPVKCSRFYKCTFHHCKEMTVHQTNQPQIPVIAPSKRAANTNKIIILTPTDLQQ